MGDTLGVHHGSDEPCQTLIQVTKSPLNLAEGVTGEGDGVGCGVSGGVGARRGRLVRAFDVRLEPTDCRSGLVGSDLVRKFSTDDREHPIADKAPTSIKIEKDLLMMVMLIIPTSPN